MKQGGYYTLVSSPTQNELLALGLNGPARRSILWYNPFIPGMAGVVGVRTNELREPLEGEWFLPGLSLEAHKAIKDLTSSFDIIHLVVIRTELSIVEISRFQVGQLNGE